MKLTLFDFDTKDIIINNEIILHINSNDEGYSFDIYSKKLYNKSNYDEGYLGGTYVRFVEIDKVNKEFNL